MSVTLSAVSHWFDADNSRVLSDISYHFETGTSYSLFGPSGSGKTTLLAVVGGLLRPRLGTIRVDGTPVSTRTAQSLLVSKISWIFQTTNAFYGRTALENVVTRARIAGLSLQDGHSAALRALTAVGLAPKAHNRAGTLSGGELQRVCIARALVIPPTLLLADEPTGQLDHQNSQLVARLLTELSNECGSTLIIATHDRSVSQTCNRMLALENGRIVGN